LLNGAHAFDVGDGAFFAGRDVDAGRNLPATTEVASWSGAGAFVCHAAFALLTCKVLRAYRARLRIGQASQVSEMHT
jgi:hypothetical protein